MVIVVEDYFGNDVVELKFKRLTSKRVNKETLNAMNEIGVFWGYDLADVEDKDTVRIQRVSVNGNERNDRSHLVKDLIYKFA